MVLTAIIPTLNEESNIRAAIESVDLADEIIVIDSCSTDNTAEVAEKMGCKVFIHPFDNFSSQKNRAIDLALNDWVLLLDADERITPELREEIRQVLSSDHNFDAFWVFRMNYFMGKEIKYSGWQNDKVIRLFRKDKCRYNGKLVHEEINAGGTVGFLKNKLIHNTYKSFDEYVDKLNHYASLQALEYGEKVGRITFYHLLLKPAFRFFRHYFLRQGYRDGFEGLAIACLQAYGVFARYAKIKLSRRQMG
jgi:glycosyltransferase involved in cell wall biosynthesis